MRTDRPHRITGSPCFAISRRTVRVLKFMKRAASATVRSFTGGLDFSVDIGVFLLEMCGENFASGLPTEECGQGDEDAEQRRVVAFSI